MLALALLGAGAPAASGAAGEPAAEVPRLRVVGAGTVNARVAYGEAPAYGYGLSPQNVLTKLPPGDERDVDIDFRDWAEWAVQNAVTIARSYPPSAIVGPRWIDLFERSPDDPARFDLRRFDERYFARLREACLRFRDDGIFVHLQLWQAVYWKKDWPGCYYHPANNVNPELCAGAGPGGFVVDPARHPELVAHQREHVRRILDATGDLGNVFYDVMNEIGNGTGVDPAWVEAILDEIEAWEQEHDIDLIVGLNDEGHDRVEAGRSLSNPRLDVAFLDLGRFDQPVATRRAHGKPTFGIRNIDWNPDTAQRFYFAGEYDLSINSDPGLLDRTQRMYWRMFMAGVMMNAGYADYGALAYRARRDDLGLGLFRAWNRDGAAGRRRGGANPSPATGTSSCSWNRFLERAGRATPAGSGWHPSTACDRGPGLRSRRSCGRARVRRFASTAGLARRERGRARPGKATSSCSSSSGSTTSSCSGSPPATARGSGRTSRPRWTDRGEREPARQSPGPRVPSPRPSCR